MQEIQRLIEENFTYGSGRSITARKACFALKFSIKCF